MIALIEAGANVNSRVLDGATPLLIASTQGYKDAMKVLLRAKADPQLQQTTSGNTCVPLDILARRGDTDAVRELIRHVDIEGCGGPSRGVDALTPAARDKHLDIVVMLTDAGVVDTGGALIAAADYGGVLSVKHLMNGRSRQVPREKRTLTRPAFSAQRPCCGASRLAARARPELLGCLLTPVRTPYRLS